MALEATVTNISVTNRDAKWYTITHQLVLTDTNGGSGFTKQYSLDHMQGSAMADKTNAFKALMQYDINCYKRAETLRKSTALSTPGLEIIHPENPLSSHCDSFRKLTDDQLGINNLANPS